MTEEEMAAAIEVNEQRNQEYKDAGILPETELPPDLTVEDIGVDLYSTTGPQSQKYRKINNGTSDANDIESGVQMQPTVSINRDDADFENTNPFNPHLQHQDSAVEGTSVAPTTPAEERLIQEQVVLNPADETGTV